MKILPLILISTVVMAQKVTAKNSDVIRETSLLMEQAQEFFTENEIYQAKQMVRKVLKKEPGNLEAQVLMSEILDAEIARQKETETTKLIDEYTDQEREDAIRTWLERSRGLLEIKQYDQAMLAAEKVFLYDAMNPEASRLVDKIKKKAIDEGKGQGVLVRKIYRYEIDRRVETYIKQGARWVREQKWGAARLAVEKALLLDPENKIGLELYEKIKERSTIRKR